MELLEIKDFEVTYEILENILKIPSENSFNKQGKFFTTYKFFSNNYYIVIDPNNSFNHSSDHLLYNYTEVEDKPVFYRFSDIKLTKDEIDEDVFSIYRRIQHKENFRYYLIPMHIKNNKTKFQKMWEKLGQKVQKIVEYFYK